MKKLTFALLSVMVMLAACSKDVTGPEQPDISDEFLTQNVKETPTYFSIAKKEAVATFDLLFVNEGRTVAVYLNGGVNGSAGVTAKNLGVVDFNASAGVDSGFSTDMMDAPLIGESWYNYDFTTHSLTSKGEVYMIKASDYNLYKMKIDSFGADGFSISYALADADGKPTAVKTATVAASEGAPGRFSLAAGDLVAKDEWDIAFLTIPLYVPEFGGYIRNPGARINSTAGVEVAKVENKAYDDISSVPDGLTFVKDEGDDLALGDAIFIYNPENHRLTPPDVVYILKTVDGQYAKLQITSYYDPETGVSGVVNFRTNMLN